MRSWVGGVLGAWLALGGAGCASDGGGEGEGAGRAREGAAPSAAVNLNSATADEIATATGLAASEARALVSAREAVGWFRSWREVLEAAPGLSASRWAALRERGRLGPPPAAAIEARIREWRDRR